jgi:glycosyltransferase involved in cell wall biosynthesis
MESKKNILIIHPSMYIGGAERALLGLLHAFDYEKYSVDLLLLRHKGEFFSQIPKQVNILPYNPQYDVFEEPIKNLLLSKRFLYGVLRVLSKIELFFYCKSKNKKRNVWIAKQYAHKYLLPFLPTVSKQYDLAINFLSIPSILVYKVKATIKAAWIHTDYDRIVANERMDVVLYEQMDYIVNVSDDCNALFLKHYPQYAHKAIVIENILSPEFIRLQADEKEENHDITKEEGITTVCSIGRFGYAKRFDEIPVIAKLLIEKGHNIKWYIIGYGNDEDLIRSKIAETGMLENVFILGKKENPYPYIKACDVYVQPSRFEGKAVTVREAQILRKPVVITAFSTSASQLRDGIDGIIVPMDNEGCAQGIKSLIEDKKLQEKLIENCKNSNFGNEKEVKKIYKLVE